MATTRRQGRGRAQRKRSSHGRARRPNLNRFYGRRLADLRPSNYEFRLTLLRGKGVRRLPITKVTTDFDWTDEAAAMVGTITMKRPTDRDSLPVGKGHVVRCEVKSGSNWRELWRMRLKSPEVNIEDGTVVAEMADDLELLASSKDDFTFRRGKRRRKKGWRAHEIAREVARRYGVRVGKLTRGKTYIRNLTMKNASPLDVIREAYKRERKANGRKVVIRMNRGRLEVRPFRRNPLLYTLAEEIESATVVREYKEDKFCTVLEAKGRVGKGKDADTVRVTELRRKVVRRYGYIKRQFDAGKVDSKADLRRQARRELAKRMRVKRRASITHACIPYIRRGDGIKMLMPDEGYKGRNAFVYCAAVSHRVSGSDRSMDLELKTEDPFQRDKERRMKELRAKKRRERRKRRRGDS